MQYLEYLEAIRDYAQEIAPESQPFDIHLMDLALNLEREIRKKFISNDDESYVKLPKDSDGVTWTGNEARYHIDGENHFLDGLLYTGKDPDTKEPRWFLFIQSPDGENYRLEVAQYFKHAK